MRNRTVTLRGFDMVEKRKQGGASTSNYKVPVVSLAKSDIIHYFLHLRRGRVVDS